MLQLSRILNDIQIPYRGFLLAFLDAFNNSICTHFLSKIHLVLLQYLVYTTHRPEPQTARDDGLNQYASWISISL